MREIASRGTIEVEAILEYVINGIGDRASNKAILYGAKTISEFKERLKTYEIIRGDKTKKNQGLGLMKEKHEKQVKQEGFSKVRFDRSEQVRCFNCGIKGHRAKDCKRKDAGVKCFRCNEFGHVSANCKKVIVKVTRECKLCRFGKKV